MTITTTSILTSSTIIPGLAKGDCVGCSLLSLVLFFDCGYHVAPGENFQANADNLYARIRKLFVST